MTEAKIFFLLCPLELFLFLLCLSYYSNCYDCVINKDEGGLYQDRFLVVAYHVYLFVNVFHSSQNTQILKIMQMLSF